MTDEMIVCRDLGISFSTARRRKLRVRDVVRGAPLLADDAFWALRNVSFTVRAGESVGFVGRNGSGKSTLLRIVAGVMLPDEGTVVVNGGIGAMLELSAGFTSELTGRDNVYLVAALHGFSRDQVDEVYDDIVEWCELARFMDTSVRHFSSGMKSRLGFALITQLNEPILLIDEALAVGDRAFRRKCAVVVKEQLSEGRTVLMVSHNENELERFCERGIYLKNGAVAFDGPMAEALEVYNGDADAEGDRSEKEQKQRKRMQKRERRQRRRAERAVQEGAERAVQEGAVQEGAERAAPDGAERAVRRGMGGAVHEDVELASARAED
jgi:ABC-2 type transport system ATP-binding protein